MICQSIDSLAAQTAAHRLIVVIGLEEGTPDVAEKAARFERALCQILQAIPCDQASQAVGWEVVRSEANAQMPTTPCVLRSPAWKSTVT